MKHIYIGAAIQIAINIFITVVLYTALSHLPSFAHINSGPFLLTYPAIVGVAVAAYLVLVRKSYKTVLGMLCGFVLFFIILSAVFYGA